MHALCNDSIMTNRSDGSAKDLFEMKETGAKTIAKEEKLWIVFGVLKETIQFSAED